MKRYWIYMICSLLVLCSGCSKKEEIVSNGPKLYYVDPEETQLVTEEYKQMAQTKKELIEEYIVAMSKEAQDPDLLLAIPSDVKIIGYNFSTQGVLQLSFDSNYYNVTGTREVLMRAAIVKTFTQIPDIDAVEFYINGLPLVLSQDSPIGRMESDDFIENVGDMTSYTQTAVISIYFANDTGDALLESLRQVEYDGSILLEQVIVEQLIAGPVSGEEELLPTIPEGTVLNKVTKKDGICTVDFNEEFLNGPVNVKDEVTIYSIVNTLAEQPSVDKVQIVINGEIVASYHTISINQPFERNLNIIESEQ